MPPTPDPVPGSSPEASILLVEEYDALAIAIGSALRKFAPRHSRRIVSSLGDARNLAANARPELIVIDLDPPLKGLITFLEELKTAQPSVRLLAIGCGTSAKFAAARAGEGAIRFLEKPFELSEFGAAIEALLAPPDDAEASGASVGEIDLADLVAVTCVNGGTSLINVQATGGRPGELHFIGGQLSHALAPGLVGEAALAEMLRWRTPHFSEVDRPSDAPRTINAPWDAVLINALRQVQPDPAPRRMVAPAARSRGAAAKTGKKIVVIDDTELLLIFVEDILSTANAQLQISTAHTGTEGCRRAELTAPDLILLDYSLPDINGDEVCRRLLENENTALIPIVMMSGDVLQMIATAQRYANVVATISKPFLSHELWTLVEKTLDDGPRAVLEVAPKQVPPPPVPPPTPQQNVNGKGKVKPLPADAPPPKPPSAQAARKAPPPPAEAPSVAEVPSATTTAAEPVASVAPRPPLMELSVTGRVETVSKRPTKDDSRAARIENITLAPPPNALAVEPIVTKVSPRPAQPVARAVAVTLPAPKTVLVGLSLRTNAVQLTPSFQIGRIRARPTTSTVSLNLPSESPPLPAILQTGFDIDFVELNAERQIETLRLVPTHRALEFPRETGREFAIAGIEVGLSSALQLTSSPASEMTIQLLGAFQIAAVELSANFAVARLLLKSISHRVRATLDGSAAMGSGVILDTAYVGLDAAGRLAEFELTPL